MLGNNMFAYCLNNPVCRRDITGTYSVQTGAVCFEETTESSHFVTRGKKKIKPRKDKRRGSEKRQPTGDRERNIGHPDGEEHGRRPKGNGPPIKRCIGDSYDINDYYQEFPGTPQTYDTWITVSTYNGGVLVDLTPPMSTYETALMVGCIAFVAAAVKMFWKTACWNQDTYNGY